MKTKRTDPDLGTPELTPQPIAYGTASLAQRIEIAPGKYISERTVRKWCERGWLRGATRVGGLWIIPAATVDLLLSGEQALPDNVTPFRLTK